MMVAKEDIIATLGGLSPEARVKALRKALSDVEQDNARHRYPSPGDLAADLDRTTVQTPALRAVDHAVADTIRDGGRLIVTIPPQEGKSTRVAVWAPVWALMRDPDKRVVVASYAETLAARNAYQARSIVNEHGSGAVDEVTGAALPDRLGIQVARDNRQQRSWGINGTKGGYYATGTGGSLTGRAADILIIDDPFKNQTQADSAREREKVWEWWTSVAQTRLAPGAAVIIIMTRWHAADLVGQILDEEAKLPAGERVWEIMNIPAVAEDGVPDVLAREPGTAMESARGRTKDEFLRIKQAVGPRVWAALYQGQPTPSEGGLFGREEFAQGRVEGADLAGRIITVDPAESGHGDEAGLLVMGWDANGVMYVEEDHSARMASATWARTAVRLAIRRGATDILYEAFTAEQTYRDVLTATWREIRRQATLLRQNGLDTVTAAEQWHNEGQVGDTLTPMQRTLEIIDLIPEQDVMPFRLVPWRKRGDKVARAAGARQSVTTGRLRMIGEHRVLERQACFVGDTIVATPDGGKRIDAVRAGDVVLTPYGESRVTRAWCSGVRETVRVVSDIGEVECTPDHLFWSPSVGAWVEAADLMEAGTIEACHDAEHGQRRRSMGTRTPYGRMGTMSEKPGQVLSAQSGAYSCTEKCGSITTGISPTGTRYTTLTTTGETMPLATSCASPPRTTGESMAPEGTRHGTVTEGPERSVTNGQDGRPGLSSARTATKRSCPPECGQSTAPQSAGSGTPETGQTNWPGDGTPRKLGGRSMTVRSVQPTGRRQPVYDITVDGVHEFYANGARVHNCEWQVGQGSPDRVDAMVNGHDHMASLFGQAASIALPGEW